MRNVRENHAELLCDHKFPLCDGCGFRAMRKAGYAQGQGGEQAKKVGCSCGTAWLCFECQIDAYETRKSIADGERMTRRGIVGCAVVDQDTKLAVLGTICRCGNEELGNEMYWECVWCNGVEKLERPIPYGDIQARRAPAGGFQEVAIEQGGFDDGEIEHFEAERCGIDENGLPNTGLEGLLREGAKR